MHALSFCRKALLFLFILAIFSASGIASAQPSPALSAILFRYLVTDWASGLACPEEELLKDLDPVLKADSPFRFLSGTRELQLRHPSKSPEDVRRLDRLSEFLVRLSLSRKAGHPLTLSETIAAGQSSSDLSGSVTYDAVPAGNGLRRYLLFRGPVTVSAAEMSGDQSKVLLPVEHLGEGIAVTFPERLSCDIRWQAERDGQLTLFFLEAAPNPLSVYSVLDHFTRSVSAGETGLYHPRDPAKYGSLSVQDSDYVPPADNRNAAIMADSALSPVQILQFLGLNIPFPSWRMSLIFLFALAGLLICAPLCLLAAAKIVPERRLSFVTWPLLCCYGISALESEIAYWLFPDPPLWRLLFKASGAICLLLLMAAFRRPRFHVSASRFMPLLLGLAADIIISIHFTTGVVCFLFFHLSLILLFQRSHKMSRQRWILWAILSAAVPAILVGFFLKKHGTPVLAVAVYAPVLILTAFSAAGQPFCLRLSAALFLLSDLLLGLFIVTGRHPVIHAVYMLLFVLALLILALAPPVKFPFPPVSSENPK